MYLYQRTNYFTTGECNISSKIEEFEKATSEVCLKIICNDSLD